MEEYADLPECRLLDKSLLHRRVKKELHEVFAELRSDRRSHLNYFWAQINEHVRSGIRPSCDKVRNEKIGETKRRRKDLQREIVWRVVCLA